MIDLLFWTSLAVVVYVYAVFPVIVLVRAKLRKRPYSQRDITPSASLIIVAHNESQGIAARLENLLSLDYPRDKVELIVASDGSADATETIVAEYAPRGIRLLAFPRQGKIAALNAAVAQTQGEVLVFSDANSRFVRDALRALVRPLADPTVGGVVGDQRYAGPKAGSSVGEHRYWDFDRKLKQWQSEAGNVVSATGAIYAIRRRLFQPLPPGVTDDFTISTGVIAQGYRLVFCPGAVAYEPAGNGRDEFWRKVRIANRGLRAVCLRRALLDPRRTGFYALDLLSHKLLRRLTIYPLLLVLGTSAALAGRGPIYAALLLTQLAFYGCAALGFALQNRRVGQARVLALPCYFCLVNAACLWASLQLLCGYRIDRWVPQRPEGEPPTVHDRRTTPCLP